MLNLPEVGFSNTGHDLTNVTTQAFSLFGTGQLVRVNANGTKIIRANLYYAGCRGVRNGRCTAL